MEVTEVDPGIGEFRGHVGVFREKLFREILWGSEERGVRQIENQNEAETPSRNPAWSQTRQYVEFSSPPEVPPRGASVLTAMSALFMSFCCISARKAGSDIFFGSDRLDMRLLSDPSGSISASIWHAPHDAKKKGGEPKAKLETTERL
jgi:hypothetical protein